LFTVTAGGQANYREGFGPLPGAIEHLPFNDSAALAETFGDDVCAVIVEPVQGEGGVIAADKAFLETIRRLCDEHNALMIMDEVQTGVGRVGALYAYESFNVIPDILTTAKGLGGGFPVAATLSTADVAASLKVGTHGSTWGGNPMGCAVANAVLDILSDPAVLQGVMDRRHRIETGLCALGEKYDVFSGVRGLGLLMGCMLTEPWQGKARDLMHAAQDEGVFVLVAGASVLRFAPSLIIPEEDIAEGLARLERAIGQFCSADSA
jgi:acetylornithine/N-succinyldiaminopimelate aminotransferase